MAKPLYALEKLAEPVDALATGAGRVQEGSVVRYGTISRGRSGFSMRIVAVCALAFTLASCASVQQESVHQEDLQSWVGRPVTELDKHPIFLTMQAVRTRTTDGTEIRNYVNGRNTASCSGGGSAFAGYVNMATYSNFANCMQSFAACNNIFYINGGVVTQYSPVGTGGAHCYTNEQTRPGFVGSANIQ